MVKLAIIGGTGVYDPDMLSSIRDQVVETVYGPPVAFKVGTYKGREVAFLPRHGQNHLVPPHKINYRANMAALKNAGVEKVFATAAVGSLNQDMAPGHLAVLDQFLDFTKGREATFFDGGAAGVAHVDVTEPYCSQLRHVLIQAADALNLSCHEKATYLCAEGPRFETAAEIQMFKHWGADVVGMTNVPEVVLARELGLCYSTLTLITNYAAGISPSKLTHQEVLDVMAENIKNVRELMMKAIEASSELPPCTNCTFTGTL